MAQVDRLENLGREIIQGFRAVGMSVPRDPPSIFASNPQGDMEIIFRDAIAKANQDFHSPPDLILIVLKASSIPVYHSIKQALDIVQGTASQVMVAEKVFKDRGLAQYLANISMKVSNPDSSFMITDSQMQVNVKLGGTNCIVPHPFFKQARWMLIGGDTSSGNPSALKRDPPPPTAAALCATWDQYCTGKSAS
jgi:hypothetical protein